MARVTNWQIGRSMSYWYPESRPRRQFAAVFDINKCIACQTCTLACKTTWTSGKGQETMLWNNVESKPYGCYPLQWDLKLLDALGPQPWDGGVYAGRTIFEAAPPGERVAGWRPNDRDYAYPNVGEDDCAGTIHRGAAMQSPHLTWFFYLARICNHCTYPACLAGWLSKPEDARPDNPVDYLVHVRKVALPLFPQFGLEPNVYYVPPLHAPAMFLEQMFGPAVEQAIRTYRSAPDDPDLAGLLGLFGSTERVVPRWRREGEWIAALDDEGKEFARVPLREPVYIGEAFDEKYQVTRTNCP